MIKIACHVHSDWSYDGKWSISALALAFKRRGFRVLMLTEHDRGFSETRRQEHRQACAAASSDDLLVVSGIEYSDSANRVHVLVWGAVPFLGEALPTGTLLSEVAKANGVSVLAHPSRRDAWQLFDHGWAAGLMGIEVWNRKADGWSPSQQGLRLAAETRAVCFVGMDFHDSNQFFPMSMVLNIDAPISESTVLDGLRTRRCHARVFDRPVNAVTQGWRGALLRVAEGSRQPAASIYRRLRRRFN